MIINVLTQVINDSYNGCLPRSTCMPWNLQRFKHELVHIELTLQKAHMIILRNKVAFIMQMNLCISMVFSM